MGRRSNKTKNSPSENFLEDTTYGLKELKDENMLEKFDWYPLHPNAKEPTRSLDSAGYDLYAVEDCVLPPLRANASHGHYPFEGPTVTTTPVKVSTGICMAFDPNYVALLWDRSSLGSKGVHRFAGVIDSSYRNEWQVVLVNLRDQPHYISAGDKIAQVLFQRIEKPKANKVNSKEELGVTERGDRGFGEGTGK